MMSRLVDFYDVTYKGFKKRIQRYIGFYDYEMLYILKGFVKRL